MKPSLIDALRPEVAQVDPDWAEASLRAIVRGRELTPRRSARVARLGRLAVVAATVGVIAGGTVAGRHYLPDDHDNPARPAGLPPATRTSPTPSTVPTQPRKVEKTYVPAAGDPKTHELRVTIVDDGRAYDPRTCVASTNSGFLGFAGPSRHYESTPVGDDVPIPARASAAADGTCRVTVVVTLPYRPRYTAGVGQIGKGIRNPDDPDPTEIVTRGTSQDVTIVNYRQ